MVNKPGRIISLNAAIVTVATTENGEETIETKTFEGTDEEVKARIEALKNVDIKIEGKEVIKEIEEIKEEID